MKKILINCSNHPSKVWESDMKKGWDKIIDIPFPNVPPDLEVDSDEFILLQDNIIAKYYEITDDYIGDKIYLMLQGEFSICYNVVLWLSQQADISLILAIPTTKRETIESQKEDGSVEKRVVFKFVKWRVFS